MNKPESAFYQLLKRNQVIPGDVSRVENTADVGMPDLSCAFNGRDYWVELKFSEKKAVETDFPSLLRPAQKVWHARREKEGSRIFLLTQCKDYLCLHCLMKKEYLFFAHANKKGNSYDYARITDNIKERLAWSM